MLSASEACGTREARHCSSANSHSSSLISWGGGEDADEDMPGNLRRTVRTEQSPKTYFCNVL